MNNDIQQIAEAYGGINPRHREADPSAPSPYEDRPPFEPVNKGSFPENFVDAAKQISKYYNLPLNDKTWGALYAAWNASTFFRED